MYTGDHEGQIEFFMVWFWSPTICISIMLYNLDESAWFGWKRWSTNNTTKDTRRVL